MFPQPDWHYPFAATHGRIAVNPSPQRHGLIAKLNQNASFQQTMVGFGGYSEGANDDVNKAVWSALYLEPDTTPDEIVEHYVSHFFGFSAGSAQGIAAKGLLTGLEKSWLGDASNVHVTRTLKLAEQLETHAGPPNWRLQAHLFRAYFDAYVQARYLHEQQQEAQVLQAVRRGGG